MFIQLEVENFRSINSKTKFHMLSRNFKRFPERLFLQNDISILKIASLYGANAAGKTNYFKALLFLKKIVEDARFLLEDSKNMENKILTPFRLDEGTEKEDSYFQIIFISNKVVYSYSLKVNSSSNRITYEELSRLNENISNIVFKRQVDENNQDIFDFPALVENSNYSAFVQKVTRQYASFLSMWNFFEIDDKEFNDDLINVVGWFKEKLNFIFPDYRSLEISYDLYTDESFLDVANKVIQHANLGIGRLLVEKILAESYFGVESIGMIKSIETWLSNGKKYITFNYNQASLTAIKENDNIFILRLMTVHKDKKDNDILFHISQESQGTKVLLNIIPALVYAYMRGNTCFIDDVSVSLHPILLKDIIQQYMQNNIVSSNGQLIFNSHEDFLLDQEMFRQDEVWLVEKNKDGESDIFSLSDFQNIRFDLDWRKTYLNGGFGAVPFEEEPNKLILE